MKLVLLGKPGSGKGTIAEMLMDKFKIPHISTGDLIRDNIRNKTEWGKRLEKYGSGFIPDELALELIHDRLSEGDCKEGFILDGFPRTLLQAESFDVKIDKVVDLDVSDETLIKRISNRRSCTKCGEVYNLITLPPKLEGKCDVEGADLYQRKDDNPETIKVRLREYATKTEPLIGFYKDKGLLVVVDSEGNPEEIFRRVLDSLGK